MKVYELLSNKDTWIKGKIAEDNKGNDILPFDDSACKWCLEGALRKCYAETHFNNFINYYSKEYIEAQYKLLQHPLFKEITKDINYKKYKGPEYEAKINYFNDSDKVTYNTIIQICKDLEI